MYVRAYVRACMCTPRNYITRGDRHTETYQRLSLQTRAAVGAHVLPTRKADIRLAVDARRAAQTCAEVMSDEVAAGTLMLTRVTQTLVHDPKIIRTGVVLSARRPPVAVRADAPEVASDRVTGSGGAKAWRLRARDGCQFALRPGVPVTAVTDEGAVREAPASAAVLTRRAPARHSQHLAGGAGILGRAFAGIGPSRHRRTSPVIRARHTQTPVDVQLTRRADEPSRTGAREAGWCRRARAVVGARFRATADDAPLAERARERRLARARETCRVARARAAVLTGSADTHVPRVALAVHSVEVDCACAPEATEEIVADAPVHTRMTARTFMTIGIVPLYLITRLMYKKERTFGYELCDSIRHQA